MAGRGLLKANFFVLVFSNTAYLLTYLIQLYLGRQLSYEAFGLFNAICNLGVVVASFSQVLPGLVAKYLVVQRQSLPGFQVVFRRLQLWVLVLALVLALGFGLSGPWLSISLQVDELTPFWLFGGGLFAFVFYLFYQSVLSSLLLHSSMAAFGLLHQMVRFGFVVLLVGYSYNGALLAALLANGLLAVMIYGWVRGYLRKNVVSNEAQALPEVASSRQMLAYVVPLSLTWLVFNTFAHADMVLVKYFTDATTSGIYAGASTLAKIALVLPSMLLFVLFPEVVRNQSEAKGSQRLILQVLGITTLLSTLVVVGFYLFAEAIVVLSYGEAYRSAAEYLPILSLLMAVMAITGVLYNTAMAKEQYGFLGINIVCTLVTLGLLFLQPQADPYTVIHYLLIGALVNLALTTLEMKLPQTLLQGIPSSKAAD